MTDAGESFIPIEQSLEKTFEHETRIRNLYAERLREYRPNEQLLRKEHMYGGSKLRGDMRTLDENNKIRIWEFKIAATYAALGQILTYVALGRVEVEFDRCVRGVLAAFEFQPEVELTVEVMNLGVELVRIPDQLRLAGGIPPVTTPVIAPDIPPLSSNEKDN